MSPRLRPERQFDLDVFDVEYVRDGDLRLLARIYQPRGDGPFPMLVDMHGGIWTTGSRAYDEGLLRAVASSGVVVAAIDVRKPPLAGYPASIADLHYAFRWLRNEAVQFRGNPATVGGMGLSTGGHQVLLTILDPDNPHYAARGPNGIAEKFDPAFLVLCWPIVDPEARYQWAKANGKSHIVARHLEYWSTEEAMALGNPQRLIEDGHVRRLPPALIVQGTGDENIPFAIVERFAQSYGRAGGSCALHLFDGEPHKFVELREGRLEPARAVELIIEFVHHHAGKISA